MKNNNLYNELKKSVGIIAASYINDGMVCGIGTGSTVTFMIEELGRRVKEEGLDITGVPTSFQSRILCRKYNIALRDPQEVSCLDLVIDGADEVDPDLNLIKGGGAAHTLEKIIAAMAREYIIIIDESKLVNRLGENSLIPIEIIPEALQLVTEKIKKMGGKPELRMGVQKDGPIISDNGQFIMDILFLDNVDLKLVDQKLHNIPGVIETGLFFDYTSKVLIGTKNGIKIKVK